MLVRIVGPDFVVGAVLDGERVVAIAPLLAAMMRRRRLSGRAGLRTLVRAHRRQWEVEVLP